MASFPSEWVHQTVQSDSVAKARLVMQFITWRKSGPYEKVKVKQVEKSLLYPWNVIFQNDESSADKYAKVMTYFKHDPFQYLPKGTEEKWRKEIMEEEKKRD